MNTMIAEKQNPPMLTLTGLSSDAQNLYNQKQAIMNNDSLTIAQQKQQMEQLMNNANSQARSELMQAYRQQMAQNRQNFQTTPGF